MSYSDKYGPALLSVANTLQVKPEFLQALIAFESGWDARAYNKQTGATGLIQFMPRTMKDFGFIPTNIAAQIPASGNVSEAVERAASNAFLSRYPDVDSQLRGPVLTYLKRYAPFPTEQSLYMAVFYPAYRFKPPEQPFPASVQAQNPGIDTVASYVAYVRKRAANTALKAAGMGGAAAVLAIAGFVYISNS